MTRARRLYWWQEVLFVLAFYGVYSFIRNQFGSAGDHHTAAAEHAREVIDIERVLGLFQEERIQQWFIDWHWFIRFWNVFYGTFHFVVTIGCIVWLFRRFPHQYVRWRTILACTTALALIGFAFYPLVPPRLLDEHGFHYHFVDTLQRFGGLWSFDDGPMAKISNQYAAMPSLHFGWSTWCAAVLVPRVRRTWAKVLAALYPVLTLFAVVVTANHYWLDAVGGAVIFLVAIPMGTWWAARGPEAEVVLVQPGR